MEGSNNIKGALTFYIDMFLALITYEYDYIHIGLVDYNRFSELNKIENLSELIKQLNGLEDFKLNQIIDRIMSKEEIEVALGRKFDGVIIFQGTLEDLFYNVIGGEKYTNITTNMMKFVSKAYLVDSQQVLNRLNSINNMHEFRGCRLINEVVANKLKLNKKKLNEFTEYIEDLECDYDYTDDGILNYIKGDNKTLSLTDNPFRFVAKNALNKCNICNISIDSDCVWESESISDSSIEMLVIKDCKIYNEDFIFVNCNIKKLVVKTNELKSRLFSGCEIGQIIIESYDTAISDNSFIKCNIDRLDTNNIAIIGSEAFKECIFDTLKIGNNLKIIKLKAFESVTINNECCIDFSNIICIEGQAFLNSNIGEKQKTVELSSKIAYLKINSLEGMQLEELINRSQFELDLSHCKQLRIFKTYSQCRITGLENIEKISLNYPTINSGTIEDCNLLNKVEIVNKDKLKISIDFIQNSSLKELDISSDEIIYLYDNSEVTQEVFLGNLFDSISNDELRVTINGENITYSEEEL